MPLAMEKPYWSTGPFQSQDRDSYEFNWTLADLLNSMAAAGLMLVKILERPARDTRYCQGSSHCDVVDDTLLEWGENPRAGLPIWLAVAARKTV